MPTERISSLDNVTMGKILNAAVGEFAIQPYNAASFNNVIKAAGISKGMMYYYFHSKEDLYSALLHSATRRVLAKVGPFHKPQDRESFWLEVARLLAAYLEFACEADALTGILHQCLKGMAAQTPTEPAREIAMNLFRWLDEVINYGQGVQAIRTDLSRGWLSQVAWGQWLLIQEKLEAGQLRNELACQILLDLWRRTLED